MRRTGSLAVGASPCFTKSTNFLWQWLQQAASGQARREQFGQSSERGRVLVDLFVAFLRAFIIRSPGHSGLRRGTNIYINATFIKLH